MRSGFSENIHKGNSNCTLPSDFSKSLSCENLKSILNAMDDVLIKEEEKPKLRAKNVER